MEQGRTYDHEHHVGKAGFEENARSDVLDEQVNAVDAEVDACVELEELENLRVEVDLRREVQHLDVDFADGN